MELVWVFVLVCISVSHVVFAAGKYENKKLVRVYHDNDDDVQYLQGLNRRHKRGLSFWTRYYDNYLHIENYMQSEVDIVSSPRIFNLLTHTLSQRGIHYDILADNLQDHLDVYMKENFAALSRDYFHAFRPYKEMLAFMDGAVSRCEGRCSLFEVGRSYEGRPLIGIKIGGTGKKGFSGEKNKIWIDAGIHAREWISHTSALYLADMLIEKYSEDPFVQHMVDTYEWYILPCVNPDGYNYTWTTDRMWRKTRSLNSDSNCVGTDANRNFDFKWSTVGASSYPCSENYHGSKPMSEPEVKAVTDFIQSEERRGTWLVYLTLHSKGQLVMSPWGFSSRHLGDHEELDRVGNAVKDAMTSTHGLVYEYGAASKILYRTSGTSRDWARGVANIKYVYTLELRDRMSDHWLLSPTEIVPMGQEVWAGLTALVRAVEQRTQGEENNMATFVAPTTISPVVMEQMVQKYSGRGGRIPISW